MRILVVGSTSVVGNAVGDILSADHFVEYAGRQGGNYYLDLAGTNLKLEGDPQFDVVIHAAADFGGRKEEDFVRAEATNALGTLNVSRLALKVGAKQLVILSSASANFQPGDPYFGIYSVSKRHGDELAQLYCREFGLPLAILRATQIYDPEAKCRQHQPLFYLIVDRAEFGQDIEFYGSNDALRNYIYLADFAKIIAKVVEHGITGVYDCPSSGSVRLSQIANTAFSAFNRGGMVRFVPSMPDILDLPVTSGEELYRKIDFEPETTLVQGIEQLRQYRSMQ